MYEVGNPVKNQTPVDKQGENLDYIWPLKEKMTPETLRNLGHLGYISNSLKCSNYFWSDYTRSFYNSVVCGTNSTCSGTGN